MKCFLGSTYIVICLASSSLQSYQSALSVANRFNPLETDYILLCSFQQKKDIAFFECFTEETFLQDFYYF